MKQQPRGRFTAEFKVEAVRLVKAGQSISMTAKVLGVSIQF
jgi:transposase-like protein